MLEKNLNTLSERISLLLNEARKKVLQSVNQTMVLTYFEIGRMIVEEEQNGKERAEYGKHLLKNLSIHLSNEFGKGFSVENLDRMRFFYKSYANRISSTALTKSEKEQDLMEKFKLSWSHYLKLMRIEDKMERSFYEIEAFKNNWCLRELNRQYDTFAVVEFTLPENNTQIFASKYLTVLPTKQSLINLIKMD